MKKTSMNLDFINFGLIAAFVFASQCALADDAKVKVLAGGPSAVRAFSARKAELDKAAGVPVEFGITPNDVAMIALSRGLVDGLIVGSKVEVVLEGAFKKGLAKESADNYKSFEVAEATVWFLTHPNNPVKSLTHEQVTNILSGKVTNWESISGQKLPIHLVVPRTYIAVERNLMEAYLKQPKSPVSEGVVDKDGLLKAIQHDPGAIGILPTKEVSSTGFNPNFIAADTTFPTYLVMKKSPSPAAEKLYEYLKAQPKFRTQ
jgi:hypothetical protein